MRLLFLLFIAAIFICNANAQIPTLSSFTPVSAKIGKTVVINGTNFHANKDSSIVYFGTTVAEVISAAPTQLQVRVPSGASYGPITVYSKGYSLISNLSFIPTFDGASFNANSFSPNIDFTAVSNYTYKIEVADFNNDMKPDIIKYPGLFYNDFSVFVNKADSGLFNDTCLDQEYSVIQFGNSDTTLLDLMVTDFNHDSLPDVLALVMLRYNAGGGGGERRIWAEFIENTSSGQTISFGNRTTYQINNGSYPAVCSSFLPEILKGSIKVSDMNYDGVPDYVIAVNWSNSMCTSTSDKFYTSLYALAGTYSPAGSPLFTLEQMEGTFNNRRLLECAMSDLNQDGRPDMLRSYYSASSNTNYTSAFTNANLQGGNVTTWLEMYMNNYTYLMDEILLEDMDMDGKKDIIYTTFANISRNVHTSGNLSSSSFGYPVSVFTASGGDTKKISDINGDKRPDIAGINGFNNTISIAQNNCQPGTINSSNFSFNEFPVLGSYASCIRVHDLDQDGKPEIITANSDYKISVLKNLITAEFVLDTIVCANENDTITYTGTAGSGAAFTWELDGGNIISGSGQGPLIVEWNTPGLKTVTLTIDENGNQTIVSRNVTVLPVPTSTFDLPQYIYVNTPNTITYTGTASASAAYSWNFDGGNILSGSDQGPYSVMWTLAGNRQISLSVEEDGCYSDTTLITKMINSIWQEERLCVVTVDPVSGKNLIVWEKSVGPDIASYLIYKEISTNFYSAIGMVPYADMSTFLDVNSNPGAYPAKYKISILDSQGSESQKSPYHKTIHLQASQGVPSSTINLQWTDYYDEEGVFVPAMYYIYRGPQPDNLTLLDSVSGSITTYSEMNVFSVYYYMIGVEIVGGCNATAKALFDGSTSNIKDISGLVGIDAEQMYGTINIYPNPMTNSATITIPNLKPQAPFLRQGELHPNSETGSGSDFDIRISDLTGKVVRVLSSSSILRSFDGLRTQDDSVVVEIDRGNLKPGVYFIELYAGRVYRGKLVVE